jgi:pyruvate kinase
MSKATTPSRFVPRTRKVRILATLGPASDTPAMIRRLVEAGADAFRINMSHGDHADHARRIAAIRALETELDRPTTILADLQGPKLRVGRFKGDRAELKAGRAFTFDRAKALGDSTRVSLPHREIFVAVEPGTRLLVDDGKLVFRVRRVDADRIETEIEVGGTISNNKGLNVPDVVLPLAALTDKDRADLAFALDSHVDWIALSFVQRPEDVAEAVPPLQKRIVEAARRMGRPVVVATQMLESMIASPSPTRAEVSDVATAVYDGADAIMLSAESASGQYPCEAVEMMNRIATSA